MTQTKTDEQNSQKKQEAKRARLEQITRSILRTIKEIDASSSGGVRPDVIKKTILEELKRNGKI